MGTLRPRALLARLLLTCLVAAGVAVASPGAAHAADRDCGDFASQRAAQIFFLKAGGPQSDPHRLDSEGDGIACESNPAPYYYGTTPPSAPPPPSQPAPASVTSRVSVSLSRTAAIAGEPVGVRTSVLPRMARRVTLQSWNGRRWVRLAVRTTTRNGAASYRVRAPRAATRYRALVAAKAVGGKRYTAAASPARALRIQRQSLLLSLSRYDVAEFDGVTATVRSTPVRAGRTVSLQAFEGGRWQTVRNARLPRSGRLRFAMNAGAAGVERFRAVAARQGGAAAVVSATRRLTVDDRTAPAQPTGLRTGTGDGIVQLEWDEPVDDTDAFDVYQGESGTSTWVLVETTPSSWSLVDGLTNGLEYEFSVVAIDVAGNRSTPSLTVSATPSA